jgi:alkylation response protein AidB-like acyl-CoA dehydrogenase
MAFTYPSSLAGLPLDANLRARVDEVTSRLGDGVLERDALGGVPDVEIVALRDAGLLVGPWAQTTSHSLRQWDQTLAAISELASVDPSAAALLGYHHMHLLLLMDSGNPDIVDWAARETAANGWVWGGANNPSGAKLTVEKTAGGYLLNGAKEFATVSLIADQLIIQEAAPTDTSPLRRIVFAVDAKTSGLSVLDDWDGIGVIRSATNGISFKDVFVPDSRFVKYSRAETGSPSAAEAASAPGFQIMFANIYLGIALGAVRRAYHLVTGENTGIAPQNAEPGSGNPWRTGCQTYGNNCRCG